MVRQKNFTYRKSGFAAARLLNFQEWYSVLTQLKEGGARQILFSGGGEPLLRKDLPELIYATHEMGFTTKLFTNGYSLNLLPESGWKALLTMEQVRISLHSSNEDTYNAVVNKPKQAHALHRVMENIREMVLRKKNLGSSTRIGIGFVVQPLNYNQVEQIADFSEELGVDFLQFRQDEVNVTRNLTTYEQKTLIQQLNKVREKFANGYYPKLEIDFSDNLTALANGLTPDAEKTDQCFIKNFRLAISPFGLVFPCDLKAEPRFFHPKYILGSTRESINEVIESANNKLIPADCKECMPSGKTGNAIISKVIVDFRMGIHPSEQPFNF